MSREATNWIAVGALADSFAPGSNALGRSDDLAGRRLRIHFDDGSVSDYLFRSSTHLELRDDNVEHAKAPSVPYLATCLRPGIYLVDFICPAPVNLSISLILDVNRKVATRITGRLPRADDAHGSLLLRATARQELTRVEVDFAHGSLDAPFDPLQPHHKETCDLVGLRVRHRYNPHELYEHIYLNENRYCWHCLEGAEAGLGDVERCHYYAIEADLYLFVWREKIVPTLGVVLIDLRALKTTGKIMGYKDDTLSAVTNFPIGAVSTIVNRTSGAP